ncbi:MAG: DUF2970 domain-containing protein [Methylococcaceae bacterium]|jgi:hypothetical protein|nr:DUF2970 domain-containing protein [Methylococcaceae bacterium]
MSTPSLLHVVKSVLAAFIGVQSEKNRQVDFKHGSLSTYIVIGLIATLAFVFFVKTVVSLVVG